ncbi:S-adenosyl-L-methionine-dependent methyltransferase [Umbelopsis sp. PMI_123]|nr:S-adenosyl-L-methionine-dependent methyltransferase [Umbelopsis sp. PMI_123]
MTNSSAPEQHYSKAIIERGYDQVADAYLAWSAPRPTLTRATYIDKLVEQLPKGANVLELGCGAGVPSTQKLIASGLSVTGVDISGAQIELARAHVPKATLIHSDMMNLEFEPASFDAVVGFYSIFHLPKDEQSIMIERVQMWLKEGGWFLCNFNSEEGEVVRESWFQPDVTMISASLGVEGTREMFKRHGQLLTMIEDEVAVEKVGRMEERFHWIFAVKKCQQAHNAN